jgi:hypothetical protein
MDRQNPMGFAVELEDARGIERLLVWRRRVDAEAGQLEADTETSQSLGRKGSVDALRTHLSRRSRERAVAYVRRHVP